LAIEARVTSVKVEVGAHDVNEMQLLSLMPAGCFDISMLLHSQQERKQEITARHHSDSTRRVLDMLLFTCWCSLNDDRICAVSRYGRVRWILVRPLCWKRLQEQLKHAHLHTRETRGCGLPRIAAARVFISGDGVGGSVRYRAQRSFSRRFSALTGLSFALVKALLAQVGLAAVELAELVQRAVNLRSARVGADLAAVAALQQAQRGRRGLALDGEHAQLAKVVRGERQNGSCRTGRRGRVNVPAR
jgi:hypothetical protein